MADLITKVFFTSALLGGAGGLGYAVTYYLSGYTLGDVLKDKGHDLLNYDTKDATERSDWEKILKSYSSSEKKLNGKVITVSETSVTNENINDLKKECSIATSSKSYSEETSLLTEQFCVKPVTVKELINKKEGRKILNSETEGNNNQDNNLWDAKIEEYSRLDSKVQMTELKLESTGNGSQETNRKKFKQWCKGAEGFSTHEKNYHTAYKGFLKWCVL